MGEGQGAKSSVRRMLVEEERHVIRFASLHGREDPVPYIPDLLQTVSEGILLVPQEACHPVDADDLLHVRLAPLLHPLHLLIQVLVPDKHNLGPRVGNRCQPVLLMLGLVQRYHRRSQGEGGNTDRNPLRAVPGDDRYAVSPPHSHLIHQVPDICRQVPDLVEGDVLPGSQGIQRVDDPVAVRVAMLVYLTRPVEQAQQRVHGRMTGPEQGQPLLDLPQGNLFFLLEQTFQQLRAPSSLLQLPSRDVSSLDAERSAHRLLHSLRKVQPPLPGPLFMRWFRS
mmetsp:Transcript_23091/g.75151  ORF Transcript_23091/g.75151 Transcript_23091/m.75151 type:complete len:281 (-) Transcript_23091:195-1037(-)